MGRLYRISGGDGLHACGLCALRALLDLVADPLAFLQAAETLRVDCRIVHEHIGAAVLGRDEAETLGVVEPLHGAVLHIAADLVLDGMRAQALDRKSTRLNSSHVKISY